ncbi:hydroxysqualene dehydroxylase HpnE [Burkholderia pseudomultivorans]|uniref:Hydroxysqualene dehydroxylase n=1 Tax=Burkholderia pseudomultivorans TaxID=1207504 RepID=A0ABU2E2J8_9BURK|nr:hydroxysqualene dehydroxylase HpnE [Burkholderia pseudomultivorans]MDR8727782.1 Hydroxysqualene dehydroxylase [Burkholderia pseudomultivorans]MDR8735746.1 Hydroxysqualene dehydroxylase [Burkholderia pseudomultivorans]MDR8742716.1 Hydroxysqualene dehydroxylase [Burkholderia pseudomultivorans]MDR8753859.1 Hydroxysqualene dehydroxylase [Burkholderia pseudomultivorans]MDR8779082.1 Hydroxysqualene dehydroxylase [Burkholderia pseudomultivorans]
MPRTVHVIGAGLAGLSAAVELQRRGRRIVLHDAHAQAGGRCRSWFDETLGATVDSGLHRIFAGQPATQRYLRAIGAADQLAGPALPEFPVVDVAAQQRWTLRFGTGHWPSWLFDAASRAPGTTPLDYVALAPLAFARTGRSLAQTMRCDGVLWDRWLRPYLLGILNVEPRHATAELARAVLRGMFAAGGPGCRPLVARHGLGSAFVDPALRMLQHGGAQIRLRSRLDAFEFGAHGNAVDAVAIGAERIELAPGDAVVLAVPPEVAQPLVPDLTAPDTFSAVVTAYFAVEPPAGSPLDTTVVNGIVDAVRAGDGQLAATIHDAARWLDMPHDTLARRIWEDVARVTGANPATLPAWQLAIEPRAGFAAVPSQEMKRPAVRTRWTNLVLAGDWIATGLPATIEGAIRSGQLAADALQTQ